jgi:acetyl esterase/lipase
MTAETSYAHIPTTISPEAQELYRIMPDPHLLPAAPGPTEIKKWKVLQEASIATTMEQRAQPLIDLLEPELTEMNFGGVPVLEIKPKGWKDNGKVIVFTHGGAYTMQNALSSFPQGGLVAYATGMRVIAVDYTLAPHAKWQEVTDQVVTVFEVLLKHGYTKNDLAIFGDSAGGGLAAASTLKLRDKGLGMPAAVVLWSPWGDVTCPGDTYTTLKDAEPFTVYELHMKNSADSYADPADQKHPYVSPVYGDYTSCMEPRCPNIASARRRE